MFSGGNDAIQIGEMNPSIKQQINLTQLLIFLHEHLANIF